MKPLIIHHRGQAFLGREGLTLETLPLEYQKAFPDLSPKYIDHLSLLAGIAARQAFGAVEQLPGEQGDFAVIVGSALGAIDSTVEFDLQALQKGPNSVNPMDFPNTVANAAGSRIGIWLQLKGPNVTLTNGSASLMDSLGFAFERLNSGFFQRCLVGAFEKVPNFLKPLADTSIPSPSFKEGACLFLASAEKDENALFEVTDHFALQLKRDFSIPVGFKEKFDHFWDDVEWLGFPDGTGFEPSLPEGPIRFSPPPAVLELGLSGMEALEGFLACPFSRGVVGVLSQPERKVSLVRVEKKKKENLK